MQSYHDQLRDPRWQRKRLEILSAANFKCENCGATDNELNVHHSGYLKGQPAWEHPDELLHCLCRDCHKERQATEESLKLEMMKRLRRVRTERIKAVCFDILEQAIKEAAI